MATILTKEQLCEALTKYYLENYGERDSDEWLEQPAANVCTFKRDGKYISLKAHILTGDVEEYVE